MLATVLGRPEVLEYILKDPLVDINAKDEQDDCNSFWMASLYNRGECLTMLANAGIDLMSCHRVTKSNALHIALERGHYKIAS